MSSIEEFIETVKKEEYVKAHEVLEDQWRDYRKKGQKVEEKAVQGLINGATALALFFIKKRPKSYEKVWKVFEKYEHYVDNANLENIEKYKEARELLISINKKVKI